MDEIIRRVDFNHVMLPTVIPEWPLTGDEQARGRDHRVQADRYMLVMPLWWSTNYTALWAKLFTDYVVSRDKWAASDLRQMSVPLFKYVQAHTISQSYRQISFIMCAIVLQ
jgi:hypothetical protein